MAAYIKRRSVREEEVEKLKSIPLPSETEAAALTAKSAAALPSGVPFNPKNASLATSMVSLPESIKEKLGLAVKYLVSRENQNWSLVLHQLNDDGGLQGIPEKDVRKMVYAIPRSQLRHVFPQIESLLASSGIQLSPKIVNCYLKSMTVGNTVNETDLKTVEKYSDQLRLSSEQGKLSRDTYEVLVEAYGKAGNVEKMNDIIKEMKTFKLSPSLNVYSNVLSTVVYKTRDHKQAVQLFDLMKFLAGSMSPSTREYQDIIVSYVNNDDIEKALDLYQEMISGGFH
ncbi:CIC11C00000004321 [Sungouiella intermedia]|uniref:Mitochondrial 15S rRNA processing factor CCM1 n=1 Tax=Sungouiella intermedia TaxID=45354 RepID=A0A1L0BXV8_9ASCO|nr:CIC11C00000004321 [[Candida] intermedia]